MNKAQITAKVLIEYISPLVESGKIPSYSYIDSEKLSAVIDLVLEKKIDSRTLRRWINDREEEKRLENKELNDNLDWLEIKAMGRSTLISTFVCPAHSNF